MEDEIKNSDFVIMHWRESSDQNYATMQNMIKTKEYSWALFMGHLVIEKLDEITTFNLNARYDDFKQSFNKLCSNDFSLKWIARIETIRKWLINQF